MVILRAPISYPSTNQSLFIFKWNRSADFNQSLIFEATNNTNYVKRIFQRTKTGK
jgi:hypothetical protein